MDNLWVQCSLVFHFEDMPAQYPECRPLQCRETFELCGSKAGSRKCQGQQIKHLQPILHKQTWPYLGYMGYICKYLQLVWYHKVVLWLGIPQLLNARLPTSTLAQWQALTFSMLEADSFCRKPPTTSALSTFPAIFSEFVCAILLCSVENVYNTAIVLDCTTVLKRPCIDLQIPILYYPNIQYTSIRMIYVIVPTKYIIHRQLYRRSPITHQRMSFLVYPCFRIQHCAVRPKGL